MPFCAKLRVWVLLCSALSLCGAGSSVRAFALLQEGSTGEIDVVVLDQNGQPLAAAAVSVEQNGEQVSRGRTTPSGNVVLKPLAPGAYKLMAEKQGFYTAMVQKVEVVPGNASQVEVRLQVVRDYKETVKVTAEPSPIDPDQPALSTSLTATDIADIPYPTTRDYRNVMAYIPGVVADNNSQIHVSGSSTQQVQDYMDGFEVSQPAGGGLALRVNPDSLRKLEVLGSRYSARFGKGSGGPVDVAVQDGDNRFRFNATDFIPTVQNVKGLDFNNWTPRVYFSGPIVKDKAWFDVSQEGEMDNNIVKELPAGADTNPIWRTADLGRVRVNLTPANVLTASALINLRDSDNTGISPFDPISTSSNLYSSLYLFTLKDQLTIARSSLLEFGAGFHRNDNTLKPQGLSPWVFLPTGREGNFYLTSHGISERTQGFTNFFLKPLKKAGTHQVSMGGSLDRIIYAATSSRVPIQFFDANSALLRQITFQNVPGFSLNTWEASAYVQDHWSPVAKLSIDAGARWDHDSFLGGNWFSPRIAGALLLSETSETKLSAGIGVYYDRTNLSQVSLSFQGTRTDQFFSPTSPTPSTPSMSIQSAFIADPNLLTMPRFLNWSVGLERRLPWRVYGRVDFISRHGDHVWAYRLQPSGNYLLQDLQQDKYDGVQITVRRELKRGYPFVFAYTRSSSRSSDTIPFSLDNLISGGQLPGPLPWDAPNLLQSWASMPLPWKFKKFDFAYSILWRSGFPFSTVDNFGVLVQGPSAHRFPDFFSFNPAIERKFTFHGYRWAARVGLNNVTNSLNPAGVDNNVDSPTFLTFFGDGHRTLNGRIRFLGKAPQ